MGVLDASECPPTFNTAPGQVTGLIAGGPGALVNSVEGAEDSAEAAADELAALKVTADDTVVGISASGRTPFAVGAVEYARSRGALTVGLACNADSALGAAAEHGIEVVVGPELLTGSTRLKAGTAQKLVLNMLSTLTMIRLGKTYGNLMVDLRASNEKLRARSRRIVELATGAPDEEIEAALTATDGEVKAAILTILGGVPAPAAERLLHAAHGHLRAALRSAAGGHGAGDRTEAEPRTGTGTSTGTPRRRRPGGPRPRLERGVAAHPRAPPRTARTTPTDAQRNHPTERPWHHSKKSDRTMSTHTHTRSSPEDNPGRQLAEAILPLVGGAANVTSVSHCMTRMRLGLADRSLVQDGPLRALPGVLGVVEDDTYQIVLGPGKVARITPEFEALVQAAPDRATAREPASAGAAGTTAADLAAEGAALRAARKRRRRTRHR